MSDSGRTVRRARTTEMTVAIAVMAGAAALLVAAGRNQWFFNDEWEFIASRDLGSFGDLMRPHNEHWTAIPIVLWRSLFGLFGTSSYLPYLAVLGVFHAALGATVFATLVRHGVDRLVALLGGLTIVLFTPGWENLFWAFQISFIGSLLALLWAIAMVERDTRRHDATAAGLLVAGGLCSGLGIPFAAGVGVALLGRKQIARGLRVAGPALVIQGAWLLWYRHEVLGAHDADVLASAALLPQYMTRGLGVALASITPFGEAAAASLVVAAFVGLAVLAWRREEPIPMAVPALAMATVAMFGIAGLSRASVFGVHQASASRYLHIAGALLLTGLLIALHSARPLRKRLAGPWQPAAVLVVGFVLVTNVAGLGPRADDFARMTDRQRMVVEAAAELLRDEPGMAASEVRIADDIHLTFAGLAGLIDRGDWAPEGTRPAPQAMLEELEARAVR